MFSPTLLLALHLGFGYAPSMTGDPNRSEASEILHVAVNGDDGDRRRLVELLQGELRELAGNAMSSERDDHTLQPTALVHEVWLKLFEPAKLEFADRQHFLAVSAQVMRQVLVDHARARQRVKRGGHWGRVQLDAAQAQIRVDEQDGFNLVALDEAMDELRNLAPRQTSVVELRFFGGLSVEETARALGISERSVAREWRFARAWLSNRLSSS